MLWRIVHKQMDVVVLAVQLHKLRLEIATDLGENGTKPFEGVPVKRSRAHLCDEDQVNVKLKHAMSAVSDFT